MDSKNGALQQESHDPAPPQYTEVATSSGSSVVVDANTGLSQNGASAPPSDPAAIKSIYGGVSGINLLTETDTIIVIDDSESMGTYGYWALVEQLLSHIGPVVATYDPNGITMYCLNQRGPSQLDEAQGIAGQGWNDITSAGQIQSIFRSTKPMGTTPIYDRLIHIVTPYLKRVAQDPNNRPRPINILVLTDGVADDTDGVEELIGEVCGLLDEANAPNNQVGIQFVQVADLDVAARHIRATAKPHEVDVLIKKAADDEETSSAWLTKLDDFLIEATKDAESPVTRDIVDTKNAKEVLSSGGYNPKTLVKMVVGALSKRHDRMK